MTLPLPLLLPLPLTLTLTLTPSLTLNLPLLAGGKQDGVELITINNGQMQIRVIPTRGCNVLDVVSGN